MTKTIYSEMENGVIVNFAYSDGQRVFMSTQRANELRR